MSEQDADSPETRSADESAATEGDADEVEPEGNKTTATDTAEQASDAEMSDDEADGEASEEEVDPETAEKDLEEIAEEPAGDIEEELAAIVGERERDGDTDEESEHDRERRVDPEAVSVDEELLTAVEETSAETVARAIGILRAEVDALEGELDEESERAADLESRLRRKQADFQNYKKRQKRRLKEEKQRATEDLVTRLLDVRDNLQRALDQDEGVDIRDGVSSTLAQFDQQLDRENVEQIEPVTGDEVDPQRHEVLATIASDQPEDAIAHVHRPGYEMAGKVLRPAQVAVSDDSQNEDTDGESESDEEDSTE